MVLGLVVIIAVVISSAVDVASQWAVGGGVLGWIAVRVLAQLRDWVRDAKRTLVKVVTSSLVDRLKRLLGPVMRSPITKAVVAVLVVGVLGWLVWRSTDDYAWVGVGVALMVVGVVGQYWWFSGRLAEWRAANPGS